MLSGLGYVLPIFLVALRLLFPVLFSLGRLVCDEFVCFVCLFLLGMLYLLGFKKKLPYGVFILYVCYPLIPSRVCGKSFCLVVCLGLGTGTYCYGLGIFA